MRQNTNNDENKIQVLHGVDNVINTELQFFYKTNKRIDTCMNYTRPQLAILLKSIKKAFVDANNRGVRLRYLTEITPDNISYCKDLMAIVHELRHLDGIKGNFMVSESEYLAPLILFEKEKIASQIVYSNVKELVEQQQYVFDTFWSRAISAEERIREIEEGIKPNVIEIIRDPYQIQELGFNLIKTATEQILIIFSTAKAFYRQMERAGAMELLKKRELEHGSGSSSIQIKILTPADDKVKEIVQKLIEQHGQKIDIRYIEPILQTKVTILVVDRKFSLVVELKDDSKDNSYEAIGLATYSNSKSTVVSYASIFEALWMQTELYKQLKEHDKMQKEFIDIAAHELRTPIQPILGLTEVVRSKIKDRQLHELQDVIIRNAKRLERLTEDILDVTRIESQSLKLNKKQFNLNDVITNAIDDITTNKEFFGSEKNNAIVKIFYQPQDIFVQADEGRISQVIHNLLDNAVKFTKEKEGIITITLEKKEEGDKNHVIVSIKDGGQGIDPGILPRLFTKFATKSEAGGTGLGLFISKSIIEAHGGRIWAENNTGGGKGATFTFSLPLRSNTHLPSD